MAHSEGRPRVALATCSEVPELDEDGPSLIAALARCGIEGVPAVWDAPDVDWESFDLVVIRSTWDYAERCSVFVAWVESLTHVLNPPEVVRWNTDKRYLDDLRRAGVPVIPTDYLDPGDEFRPPDARFVVKPAVSAGSRNAAAYEPDEGTRAGEHVRTLLEAGRTVLVQPYLSEVDQRGETALIYLGGRLSHAIRKGSLLDRGEPPSQVLYLEESIAAGEPTSAELAVGERTMAALPSASSGLLYGRVDLAPGPAGKPLVLEVELTEPSLFLGFGDGAADRFADAIAAAVRRPARTGHR